MLMKNKLTFTALVGLLLSAASCTKYLEPQPDNSLSKKQILSIPAYAEGLLLNAYRAMPSVVSFDHDVITDDGVSNDPSSAYRLMATGSWSADNDPVSQWNVAYKEIYYVNLFLQDYGQVTWDAENAVINALDRHRLKGEAYGLRAWWEFQLLEYHAGLTADGRLMGFPIVLKPLTVADNLNLPRATFADCVARIVADCDTAIANLPGTYADVAGEADQNQAMGARWTNRMDGYAARALKSRVTLFAASPAFNLKDDASGWQAAAKAAGELLQLNGGVASLSPTGLAWYTNSADPEIIWARAIVSTSAPEAANFPPSLLGSGRTDPSQNLVNAFPMKNGYPIDNPLSGYDASHPYAGRDPRLADYIIYNGNTLGAKGQIFTYLGAPLNGTGVQTNSTRTGYYLSKFMLDNVSVSNPTVNQNQFNTYFRFTEVFLNYAEAANEAWGPDADPQGYGFTPRSILAAIRRRAGIAQPDNYLASLTTRDAFRALVHNERRLELCFEGRRFNDLRRWKDLAGFQAPVQGVSITQTAVNPSSWSYAYSTVEQRDYKDYMIYGPIPRDQVLKSDSLQQNKGW
jgi:hypothetical protein